MIRTFSTAFIAALLATATAFAAPAEAANFTIDASHSTVVFRIKHVNASYFWGTVHGVTGTVKFNPKKPQSLKLNVSIPTKRVFTANKKRDQHLKGPDFFDAKRYPVMTFKSTSVKKAGKHLSITGVLTLHGVSKTVKATAEYVGMGKGPYGKVRAGWEARLTIDRTAFGMKYGIGVLSKKVQLIIALEAIAAKK